MPKTFAQSLHDQIEGVCPISGVSIGRKDDRKTWFVAFDDSATESQKLAAAKIIESFEFVEEAPQIAKSVVTSRLIAAGKIDVAVAAIMSNPSAFARWVAPDKPVINADDPEAIAMLSAIGADPDKILAVTE